MIVTEPTRELQIVVTNDPKARNDEFWVSPWRTATKKVADRAVLVRRITIAKSRDERKDGSIDLDFIDAEMQQLTPTERRSHLASRMLDALRQLAITANPDDIAAAAQG